MYGHWLLCTQQKFLSFFVLITNYIAPYLLLFTKVNSNKPGIMKPITTDSIKCGFVESEVTMKISVFFFFVVNSQSI